MGKSNQKTVKVVKELCNKDNLYTAINLNALTNAGKILSGDAFKMWIYFSKNQNNYEFELSSKHAEETFSLSKRRYDNAIHELIENRFLVDTNTDPNAVKNSWTFREIPLAKNEDKPLQQNDISPVAQDYKPSNCNDTRNNTDITNNKKKNMFPEEKPEGFDNMTDAQRREYFKQHVF